MQALQSRYLRRVKIVSHLRDFIFGLGSDFTFVGKEYLVKVGKSDFSIDFIIEPSDAFSRLN